MDEVQRIAEDEIDHDDFDRECWNCAGEGFVTGCSWDWQCDTYDAGEGTCLCTRPCHICHPPKHDPALRKVLADVLGAHLQGGNNEI